MNATTPPSPPTSSENPEVSGFPLAALFLLTALCSVLAALALQYARSIVAEELQLEAVLFANIVGALAGMGLGSLLGLAQRGPVTGLFLGGPTGFVLGAVIGPLCLVPTTQLSGVMGVTIGGSVLLVVVAIIIRVVSSHGADKPD